MTIPSGKAEAVACIMGTGNLRGTVKFYSAAGFTLVVAEILGLPDNDTGFHGFHIHEGGSCAGSGFVHTGSHYHPGSAEHPRHAGDLPPLLSCNGRALLVVATDRFTVREIIGRTVVIHAGADDLTTQPAGGAGKKIACGVIRQI